jgi:hypothetical protein
VSFESPALSPSNATKNPLPLHNLTYLWKVKVDDDIDRLDVDPPGKQVRRHEVAARPTPSIHIATTPNHHHSKALLFRHPTPPKNHCHSPYPCTFGKSKLMTTITTIFTFLKKNHTATPSTATHATNTHRHHFKSASFESPFPELSNATTQPLPLHNLTHLWKVKVDDDIDRLDVDPPGKEVRRHEVAARPTPSIHIASTPNHHHSKALLQSYPAPQKKPLPLHKSMYQWIVKANHHNYHNFYFFKKKNHTATPSTATHALNTHRQPSKPLSFDSPALSLSNATKKPLPLHNLTHLWKVKVDDDVDRLDVDPPCKEVRRHEVAARPVAEVVEDPVAVGLGHPRVDVEAAGGGWQWIDSGSGSGGWQWQW